MLFTCHVTVPKVSEPALPDNMTPITVVVVYVNDTYALLSHVTAEHIDSFSACYIFDSGTTQTMIFMYTNVCHPKTFQLEKLT